MDVIFDAADLKRLHPVLDSHRAKVLPNPLFELAGNPRLAILGAEHQMDVQRRKGGRHGEAPGEGLESIRTHPPWRSHGAMVREDGPAPHLTRNFSPAFGLNTFEREVPRGRAHRLHDPDTGGLP